MPFTSESASKAGKKSKRRKYPKEEIPGLKIRIEELINTQWDRLVYDFHELTPRSRVDAVIKLLEYTTPKMNRVETKDITTIEDFLQMTPDERKKRISEIQNELKNN